MDKELIKALKLHMDIKAHEVGLKVYLKDQDKFMQIQLLDKDNMIIYTAYEVNEIISFIHGLQSDYRP